MDQQAVQCVVDGGESGVYLLVLIHDDEEEDSADSLGHVFAHSSSRQSDASPSAVLATSDTLRAMWGSPSGALWVASSDGNVGTNAPVRFPTPVRNAEYKTVAGPPWVATELPALTPDGLLPDLDVIWGVNDECVFAAAVGGHIYRWDGRRWALDHRGEGEDDISAFGGSGPNDVFAVGVRRTLLHFDGSQWHRLSVPPPVSEDEALTGVVARSREEVFICAAGDAHEGRVLHGNATTGFVELARCRYPLIAIATLRDRIFFATGDGVAELKGKRIQKIKSTFDTVAMFSGKERIFVLEPSPGPPGYIEYDPREVDAPWWGYEF